MKISLLLFSSRAYFLQLWPPLTWTDLAPPSAWTGSSTIGTGRSRVGEAGGGATPRRLGRSSGGEAVHGLRDATTGEAGCARGRADGALEELGACSMASVVVVALPTGTICGCEDGDSCGRAWALSSG
jgi:hypothetical protein